MARECKGELGQDGVNAWQRTAGMQKGFGLDGVNRMQRGFGVQCVRCTGDTYAGGMGGEGKGDVTVELTAIECRF